MTDRPFRFGIMAGYAPDVATFTGLARRAEDFGFDTLITPDPVTGRDPLTALASVAAVTSRLHFGTFVLAVSYRDKKMLNWQARTLHELSGGRFELGLGTGRPGGEQHAAMLGREFGTPRQRFDWLAETVAEVKQQEDRPRLLLSGSGPKLFDLAAREADTVTFTWRPQTTEAEVDVVVERFKEAAGDRFADIELNINLIAVGDNLPPQTQKFIGMSAAELAATGAVSVLPGGPEENADRLLEWRSRWGISYVTVSSNYLEQFAPVITKLGGS
jgi:probable F420-dependent oxidoreductase